MNIYISMLNYRLKLVTDQINIIANNIFLKEIYDANLVKLTEDEVQQRRNEIKKAIVEYGCVVTGMETGRDFYDDTLAYNTKDANANGNHMIIIVGWDDNYPVENFAEEYRPKNPGAYLIQNSWGANAHQDGCFWLSYEDILVEREAVCLTSASDIDYDNIYQYDESGMSRTLISKSDKNIAYGANVFTKRSLQTENLVEVRNNKCNRL